MFPKIQRTALIILLAAIVATLLSACGLPAVQPAPTARPTGGPITTPITPQPGGTTAPATPQPGGTTAPATPQPGGTTLPTATAQPPRPGLPALLGPEWRILAQGDIYGTGVETAIGYWPSGAGVTQAQLPPQYVGFSVITEQVVVVQRNPQGQPWVRLQISLNGVFLNGDNRNPIFQPGTPDSRTSALALALGEAAGPIRVVPIDRSGQPVEAGFAARLVNGSFVIEPLKLAGQPQPLLGPEWRILGQGDLYGLGAETVVAYRPSSYGVTQAQLPPQYVGYGTVLEQLAIVQRNPNGEPWIRVLVTPGGIFLNGDNRSPIFPAGGPDSRSVAFALAMEQQSAPQRLVPLDVNGKPTAKGFSVSYDAGTRGFKLAELTLPGDQAAWPGGDWQIAHQGDFNGDGLVEQVAVLPSALIPDPSFNTPVYAAYSRVAEAIMIGQEQGGAVRVLATINLSEARSEHEQLAALSSPQQGPQNSPAAFLVAAPLTTGQPVAVIPINSSGQGYTQGFGLTWDAAKGAYRLISGPEAVEQLGQVSGRVGYPAGGAPPLEVYAINADDPARYELVYTQLNQPIFSFRLPAGRYYFLAYPAEPGYGDLVGAYSEYVRCGMTAGCADHTLVAVTVKDRDVISDLNIGDWYAPAGTFPARPKAA